MEVMSLEGRLEDVIHSVNNVVNWLGEVRARSILMAQVVDET
jgi:hypothetical protein